MNIELDAFRSHWLLETTRSSPDSRARAELALSALYREYGRSRPPVAWFPSPTAAADPLGGPPETRNQSQFRAGGELAGDSLTACLVSRLRDRLDHELSAAGSQERQADIMRELSVRDVHPTPMLLHQLEPLMRAYGELDLGHDWSGTWTGAPEFHSGLYGPHLDWLAVYAFYRDRLGVGFSMDASRQLDDWLEVTRCSSGVWLYEGVIVTSDPPWSAHFDNKGRLHHASGPALTYSDGSHWFWHGVQVPEGGSSHQQGYHSKRS